MKITTSLLNITLRIIIHTHTVVYKIVLESNSHNRRIIRIVQLLQLKKTCKRIVQLRVVINRRKMVVYDIFEDSTKLSRFRVTNLQ